ncbi:TIGR03747 family integrating conjugative element membrane protein [Salmonella enterica subsp. enterica serovar Newport]|uniref:TIGR03747 family integrating conjugative element membrane protein n=1 Tax=Salmonella enterica subsp. salamae TaxID=59202 RepID=A0A8F7YIN5_SALER|nr:TIGR03747 family integrating conjugative element membrane protein [Salmonella enterica]EBV1772749.1 TIGR03747 family integrating conjugative element membrane protein [Salmonella enterica subsp. enterica serovar Muenchen]ECA2806357.1 TIGR03747 family integrating conjugative element membrane protein [Salmonella enterica subsp. enterica serovar Newport]EBW5614729.1 TIGR03747 family integrating conjugative element membrane protein [Salmonella enterica subsp. enterica serovar Muenchen]ECA5182659.
MSTEKNSSQSSPPPRKPPGLLTLVLWIWPVRLLAFLLVSWMAGVFIEWAGMFFFWSDQGALHSQSVMNKELGYLSADFTQSLIFSSPSVTTMGWISSAYQWAFVDSGLLTWIQKEQRETLSSSDSVVFFLGQVQTWLLSALSDYLLALVYVTVVFAVRVLILVLSIPLFVLVIIVAVIDGLCRRDLRRYGAGYESSFLYHHAKRFVKPAVYLPCLLYLSWPVSIYPNLLLLPGALLLGLAVTVVTSTFKKYL